MYLLYLDESGAASDASLRHFVLAGISVFERQTHWIEQELNAIAKRFAPIDLHTVELHGSPMRSGCGFWRRVPKPDRLAAVNDALGVVANNRLNGNSIFAAVIRKDALDPAEDPVKVAFTELSKRFDQYLGLKHLRGDTQRGVMILDKSNTEQRLQLLAREFKYQGHGTGSTHNYAEVPLFLDSKSSRLIQLADLIAFAIFRQYEHNDSTFFDVIKNCFHRSNAQCAGLYERL